MDTVIGTDTITHVYSEYEWASKFPVDKPMVDLSLAEYQHNGVMECTNAGKRFFCVLTKPDDLLLDNESKPKNVITVDTWKWRAQAEAEDIMREPKHLYIAMLGAVAALADKARYADHILGIQLRGYPMISFQIPEYLAPLFEHLPDEKYSSGVLFNEEDMPDIHLFFGEFAILERLKASNG